MIDTPLLDAANAAKGKIPDNTPLVVVNKHCRNTEVAAIQKHAQTLQESERRLRETFPNLRAYNGEIWHYLQTCAGRKVQTLWFDGDKTLHPKNTGRLDFTVLTTLYSCLREGYLQHGTDLLLTFSTRGKSNTDELLDGFFNTAELYGFKLVMEQKQKYSVGGTMSFIHLKVAEMEKGEVVEKLLQIELKLRVQLKAQEDSKRLLEKAYGEVKQQNAKNLQFRRAHSKGAQTLRRQRDSLRKERDSLRKERDDATFEAKRLRKERDSLRKERDDATSEAKRLKRTRDSLRKERDDATSEAKRLKRTRDDAMAETKPLKKELGEESQRPCKAQKTGLSEEDETSDISLSLSEISDLCFSEDSSV